MIVVDSSVWIAHLRNHDIPQVRRLRAISRKRNIIIGDLVLVEVLQGARGDRHAKQIEDTFRQFTPVRMLDPDIAVEAARLYRALRADGYTVRRTVDLIIATFCVTGGHHLLHGDRDFAPFVRRFGLMLA